MIEPKQDFSKSKSSKNDSAVDSLTEEDVSKHKTRSRACVNTKTFDSDKGYDSRKKKKLHVNERNLRAHIKTFHGELRTFQCKACNKAFSQKNHLNRHTNAAHPIDEN